MAYTVTTTAVKPAGILWFNKYDNSNSMNEINWIKTQPGYVSLKIVAKDANTIVSTLVFEDQASYDAMVDARSSRADWIARQNYCSMSGIKRTVVKG